MAAAPTAQDLRVKGVSPVTEEPLLLGARDEVVSILARPESAVADRPVVLILNAGVIHRVGPHRLHVTLARRLAAAGTTSLRMDLSGVGDSPLHGTLPFREQAVVDIRAAMDKLTDLTGSRRFVLFGLCSGADNGLATALADDRVVGLVLVDPFTYPTLRSQARKLVARARQLGTPRRVVEWGVGRALNKVQALLSKATATAADDPSGQSGREPPPPEVFGAQLERLLARRVSILACYSGALGEGDNHPDQLFELLPRLRGRVERRYFRDANHVFTEQAARRELIDTVCRWIQQRD